MGRGEARAAARRDRTNYYGSLELAQKGDLDITRRLVWFVGCFSKTLAAAELACVGVLRKAYFWQRHSLTPLNDRQKMMLSRYLDGF